MLGGDKRFNDRLCWALLVPLSLLAWWAVDIVFMGAELLLEGREPGSAQGVVLPLKSLFGGYAAVLVGAKVAPERKAQAALALATLYGAAALAWAFLRPGEEGIGSALLVSGTGIAGAGAAVYKARP